MIAQRVEVSKDSRYKRVKILQEIAQQAIVTVAQHAHLVLAVRWNSRSSRWPCYAQVQRSGVIQGYNQLVDHVGIHGQRSLTEALNKDSLV
ncbi:hypothetical protein Taro_049002 [Colocasia esculenta]|uniref:Uncharacterized protein n=1 Tax=Colocasia esculenta TaxID=4460 RepID=A0A843X9L3_COLES|nr:hypothetical protein [Colocasia esculenta]